MVDVGDEEIRAVEVVDVDAVDMTTFSSKRTSSGLANISENDVLTIVSEIEK